MKKEKKRNLIFLIVSVVLFVIYFILLIILNHNYASFYSWFFFISFGTLFSILILSILNIIYGSKFSAIISYTMCGIVTICLPFNLFVVVFSPLIYGSSLSTKNELSEKYGTLQLLLNSNSNPCRNRLYTDYYIYHTKNKKCFDSDKIIYDILITADYQYVSKSQLSKDKSEWVKYFVDCNDGSEAHLSIYKDATCEISVVTGKSLSTQTYRYYICFNKQTVDLLFEKANEIINSFLESNDS